MTMTNLIRWRAWRSLSAAGLALLLLDSLAAAQAGKAQAGKFELVDRDVIQARLRLSPRRNADREATLEKLFQQSGCAGANLAELPVRRETLPNVVCTLPGTTPSVIIVGAHFDHVWRGRGIIDNWSGASLLPSLIETLRHEPRKHTFVFIGFTAEEEGLVGSKFYAKNMTPDAVAHTRALINLDSLALGPTKVWLHHSDQRLATAFQQVAASLKLPLAWVNFDQEGDDDSEPFTQRKIPTLVVHSVTPDTFSILHSFRDSPSAVKFGDYYDTYRLLAAYLAVMDAELD
ncbi:MAG TPA: M28 family peptidase [Terriglobia bacterium]|nr:M28 family peptidase [Terriglobia bacterium]